MVPTYIGDLVKNEIKSRYLKELRVKFIYFNKISFRIYYVYLTKS